MLAKQNSVDDANPWEIIRMVAPAKLQGVWIIIPPVTSPMWPTEEYAIMDLRSICRRQMIPVMIMLQRARIITG